MNSTRSERSALRLRARFFAYTVGEAGVEVPDEKLGTTPDLRH